MKEARQLWFEQFLEVRLDQFVFLDEFGAATNMTRSYARAPRGQRAVCKVPQGHWKVIFSLNNADRAICPYSLKQRMIGCWSMNSNCSCFVPCRWSRARIVRRRKARWEKATSQA